jgi:hypothetical protein
MDNLLKNNPELSSSKIFVQKFYCKPVSYKGPFKNTSLVFWK